MIHIQTAPQWRQYRSRAEGGDREPVDRNLAVGSSIVLYLEDDYQEPETCLPAEFGVLRRCEYRERGPSLRTGSGARVYTISAENRNWRHFDGDDGHQYPVFIPDMCTSSNHWPWYVRRSEWPGCRANADDGGQESRRHQESRPKQKNYKAQQILPLITDIQPNSGRNAASVRCRYWRGNSVRRRQQARLRAVGGRQGLQQRHHR